MKTSQVRATVSAASVISCLLLTVGVAGAQSVSNTGAGSRNVVSSTADCNTEVLNDNEVKIRNNNPQDALSGDTDVSSNTTTGQAGSGNATNQSGSNYAVEVNNTSPALSCQGDKPAVTSAGTTNPTPTPTPTRPSGGQGNTQPQPAPQQKPQPQTQAPANPQVQAPAGGVGAGVGGPGILGGLASISLASGAWAFARIRKQHGFRF